MFVIYKINIDMDISYTVEYNEVRELGYVCESTFKSEINGNIFETIYGETDKTKKIGYINIKIFHVGSALNSDCSIGDTFDLSSADYNIYEEIFIEGTNEFKEDVDKFCEENFTSDIIIIDRFFIDKEYRGKGISSMIIEDLKLKYGCSCKFIALKSFPLQFEGGNTETLNDPKYDGLIKDEKKASIKLNKHYKKIGFKNIKSCSKDIFFLTVV